MKKYSYIFLFISFFYAFTILSRGPLRVLVVTPKMPCISRTFDLDDIIGLINQGCKVSVYAIKRGPLYHKHPDHDVYGLDNIIHYAEDKNTQEFLKKNKFDIFLCENGQSGYHAINLKRKLKHRARIVVKFRGPDVSIPQTKFLHYYDKLLSKINCALPMTKYLIRKLTHNFSLKPRCKMVVFPNSINLQLFKSDEYKKSNGNLQVITIARLDPMKGVNYAIDAFARVAKIFPQLTYVIIGEGIEKNKLMNLIESYELTDRIKLLGVKKRDEILQLLRESDIYLHPSVTARNTNGSILEEGMPTAIQEAMAIGLPVISTYHAGIPEVIKSGINGLLAQERDVQQLVDYLCHLIEHDQERSRIGMNGKKTIEEGYSSDYWDKMLVSILYSLRYKDLNKRTLRFYK